jgi:hypothetical protein
VKVRRPSITSRPRSVRKIGVTSWQGFSPATKATLIALRSSCSRWMSACLGQWRGINLHRLSSTWKDECECKAENFATVPKQTLGKSFSSVVHSGFNSYSLKKVLWNLPELVEERDAQSDVQQTLLQTLLNKRYNAPANTAAARSKETKRTRDCENFHLNDGWIPFPQAKGWATTGVLTHTYPLSEDSSQWRSHRTLKL